MLPYAETPIIEDEHHLLVTCPQYHLMKLVLNHSLKSLILRDDHHYLLFASQYARKMGQYVKHIFILRFPENKP